MPPRKKPTIAATTSSKKPTNKTQQQQQQNQPSQKFGIQHFFERHTQNTQKPTSSKQPTTQIGSDPDRKTDLVANSTSGSNLGINPRNESGSKNGSQSTPVEDLIPVVKIDDDDNDNGNVMEVSPEFCKAVSRKRIKFSPGMLIDQSQDDGGDEITWRISPVNERLHALTKNLVEVRKVLGESSRFNIMKFKHTPDTKISPCSAAKLEKFLSSPPGKAADLSSKFLMAIGLEKRNLDQDMMLCSSNEKAADKDSTNFRSPFKTPPSCHDKAGDIVETNAESSQMGSRQHKKALLELLDQVEDVICTEDQVSTDSSTSFKDKPNNSTHVESDVAVERPRVGSIEKVNKEPSNVYFLVFEVSEKQYVGSNGSQCSSKVLRLLNEQCGEERSVYLSDEWYHSVISPGDTVHVIGEFNEEGKCDVNRDSNFLIVHPDILVSGTRVAGSFSCHRRTVLDERLKNNEQSAPALIGTLLHQLFQAGLIMESPTKEFLEEYARVLLQKNYEGLYACGVYEGDIHKTMIESIPKLLNWILCFRDSQSPTSSVDFGSTDEVKKVKVEVIDIEEMAWAPRYGMKGVIDASMHVQVASKANETSDLIMPFEFKTGKATNGQAAMEHSAQVMLYTLLMSERYKKNIDYGLLYYLHTDQTQGITVRRSDMVGLIMRRNELASDILKASMTQQLPPMSQVPNMCKSCRHLNACTVYHKAHSGSIEGSGLGDVYSSLVNHLTAAHCVFLKNWERLIDLEANELEVVKKEIGVIMDMTRLNVTLSFSKRLRLPGSRPSRIINDLCQEVWRIDKDEFTASFATMRFNLIQMFLQDDRSSHLRSMIVDLHAPRYDGGFIFSQDPAVSYIWSEKTLNDDQRKAILKALLMRGASILLTSYTNSAVDNLLIKLKSQGIDFIRIGRLEAVHEEIRGHCINAADMQSTKDIKTRLDGAKVVAVTCLGITSPLLCDKKFDVCIMDEAGQITLPVSLGPLMFASMFVLVGDHYQLPPLVQSTEARENGMGASLFCRLSEAHPQAISALQSQYRMCAPIMELSNALIYGDRLRCGSTDVANAKLEYTSSTSLSSWLKKVLDPLRQVIFINTDLVPGLEVKDGKTVNNPLEAYIITEITDKLTCQGIRGEDIGVITPYNSQVNLIQQSNRIEFES
nr:DNA replication ATP-dependent helicase/nuclease DNA2 [Tanacetum cinerariifolium]